MIATLKFNLPEEKEEFDLALKGMDYSIALHEFDQQTLRSVIKYGCPDELHARIIKSLNEYEPTDLSTVDGVKVLIGEVYAHLRGELRDICNEYELDY